FFWTIGGKIDDIRTLYMFQSSTHGLVLYIDMSVQVPLSLSWLSLLKIRLVAPEARLIAWRPILP
ncbi:MAG TPA: hypothetical protein VI542_33890, partial [Candidatus Tectomicrobia bacterium]